jgi:hypothetical protein
MFSTWNSKVQVTNCTKQNHPLIANKSTVSQIVRILWNQKVRSVFKRTRHLDRSWTRWIQWTPFIPVHLRTILYHPPIHNHVFQVVSFFESERKEIMWTLPPYVSRLSHLPWRHHRSILWVQIMKLHIMPFSPVSCSFLPLISTSKYLLRHLFWNTLLS